MGSLIWVNYIYQVYIIGDFAAYPEPVAAKLRRALYYTNIDLQPKLALKYYRQAILMAGEMGIDPFSDPIIGVKIQLAAMFEKCHAYEQSIGVLEILRKDNVKWLEEHGQDEGMQGKRTSILGKTIGVSVKLGELYALPYVQKKEEAEERLIWAVTAVLKEQKRREDEGVKEGEGEWMSNEEIGGALEGIPHPLHRQPPPVLATQQSCSASLTSRLLALGTHYTTQSLHYLSAPLYLQALGLSPPPCHAVILMNNLATALALQSPPSSTSPSAPSSPSAQLDSARTWAEKAIEMAAGIKPPERTSECDEGCAVAMVNLGDFAMMEGRVEEARRRWVEGRGLSRAVGMGEGVQRAERALREVEKKGRG